MSSREESPDAAVDVIVRGPVSHQASPIAEVTGPPAQQPVEPRYHVGPWCLPVGSKHGMHRGLQPVHALLGRLRCQIRVTILPIALKPEGVAQEVKPLALCVPDTRLAVVEGQTQLLHRPSRPRQRLGRMTATEDNEVVRVGDDARLILVPLPALTPGPEIAMHVNIGEQRTGDPTLRGP